VPTSRWSPNPEQAAAAAHGAGPLRIQAGAGSGKTTTLGYRIVSLVERGFCRADQILLLTFTTKAVEDLRRKVAGLLGEAGPRIETYHAFALSIVREFADRLGLPPDPALLTEAPLKLLMRQQIDRLGLEHLDLTRIGKAVDTLVEFAGWHRHEGAYRTDRSALLERLTGDQSDWDGLLQAYDAYRELLRAKGAVDYDDLIALAVQLLESCPDVRADLQERYPYLLVDEYQDTDFLQGEMVRLLAGDGANVTIVGDPDQTIYSFRGAAMSNIRQFHQLFPAVADVTMVTNYRSTPEILAAANASISCNTRRKPELLRAARESGERPRLVEAPTWPAEAAWLARQVGELRSEGYRYADMAVLVRKNIHKAGIYAALTEAGIPVQVVGGFDLFDDPEALRTVGYIRALAAPQDNQAVIMALSMPRYGLSDRDIAALGRQRGAKESLLDVVSRAAGTDGRLKAFVEELWPLYSSQFGEGCQAAVRKAIDLHAAGLGPETRAGVEQLLALADSFFAHPELFAGNRDHSALALFTEYLDALRSVGDPVESVQFDSDQDSVKLMTVHAAKGLEFPVLFLPRLTASDFPGKARKWDRPFPLEWHHDAEFAANVEEMLAEEERRLFYVALTRAMDRLYLSWAPVDPRRKKPLTRSAFVDEVAGACDVCSTEETELNVTESFDLEAAIAHLVSAEPVRVARAAASPAATAAAAPDVLSFSHLHTYQTCPFRFYQQYLLHLPGRPNRAADEGVRVHAAIERLAAAGGAAGFAEFAGWAAAPAPPDAESGDRLGPEIGPAADDHVDPLQAFWESEYARTAPLASEQEFFLRVGPAVVRGFIDRLHPLPDGGVEVVDFKTYTRMQSEAEVKAGLQLPLYLLGAREALGHKDACRGALFFLKHGKVVRVRFTEQELEQALHQAEGLVAAIRRRDWAPTPAPGVCGFCPYRDGCPVAM